MQARWCVRVFRTWTRPEATKCLLGAALRYNARTPVSRAADLAVAPFRDSMPERYRAHFDGGSIQEHAKIVGRRGRLLVHLEIWQRLPNGQLVLCVVADDRPGLLSFISASLVAHEIDVVAVKAYTRTHPETGHAEAVDFLWVKRQGARELPFFVQADLTRIANILTTLVSGAATVESVLQRGLPRPRPPSTPPRVRFEGASAQGPALLTVEAADRPGLLLAITMSLFRNGVQILASDATTQDGRVVDRFTIAEADGTPLGQARRNTVQNEVLSAIETLGRGTSSRRSSRPPKPR